MTPNQYTPEEPISSIATALAPAALGIVRVSGKGCIELVSKVFSRPKALLEAPGNTLVYGWILDDTKKIDEVMLAVYRAPKSFTFPRMQMAKRELSKWCSSRAHASSSTLKWTFPKWKSRDAMRSATLSPNTRFVPLKR